MTPGSETAAVVGVGYTPFTRRSGRSVLDQALEACRNAVQDAGLATTQVDGIASFMLMHDSVPAVAVASGLALPRLGYVLDAQLGGQAPCYLVGQAAAAVRAGHADCVVVFRALNGRSGARVGTMPFPGPGGQYRYPIGYDAYLMYCRDVGPPVPDRNRPRRIGSRGGRGPPNVAGRRTTTGRSSGTP